MTGLGRRRWAILSGAGLGCLFAGCLFRPAVPSPTADWTAHEEPDLVDRHTVAPGETLYRIGKAYGVSVEAIELANGISDVRELKVGQELIIPIGTDESANASPHASRRTVEAGARREKLLRWPLKGVLYAHFGRRGREPHDGIDLAAPLGTPIGAAGEGKVIYAGEQKGYGRIVLVEHEGGLVTLYAHDRDLEVKAGQAIQAGQTIATVGESGRSSGPHLHFEVRKDGIPVDPLAYLPDEPPP